MRFTTVQHIFFFVLITATTLAFFGLLQDFLLPVFWAAVLATLFFPIHRRVVDRLNGRANVAAMVSLLAIIFVVILPLFFVGLAVSRESIALYNRIASGEIDPQELIRLVEGWIPIATDYAEQFGVDVAGVRENLSQAAVQTSQFLASRAIDIGQNAVRFTVLLSLMLYVLFFFLRDGERILQAIFRAIPLDDHLEQKLFSKFADVARATIKGTLIVGVVQGSLGGLLFWVLGLPLPVFWGVIMTVLSFLPAVGSGLVWAPAAIILMASGELVKGIILIAAGVLLIGLVDNVLRPILVGRDTRIPDYLILLSTLGGLTVFGLSGFVIGPVIAALFLTVWQMFEEEYSAALPTYAGEQASTGEQATTHPDPGHPASEPRAAEHPPPSAPVHPEAPTADPEGDRVSSGAETTS